ncbi:MAG: hypothetical protein ACI8V2_002837 [Candidatus Latescibacterota bacterium]|jgi:hypothetical protein
MPPRRDTRRSRQRRASEPESRELPYSRRNIRFFMLGIVFILVGYFCTARPPVDGFVSLTLAPILLGLGYCVFIPIALLIGEKKDTSLGEEPIAE